MAAESIWDARPPAWAHAVVAQSHRSFWSRCRVSATNQWVPALLGCASCARVRGPNRDGDAFGQEELSANHRRGCRLRGAALPWKITRRIAHVLSGRDLLGSFRGKNVASIQEKKKIRLFALKPVDCNVCV